MEDTKAFSEAKSIGFELNSLCVCISVTTTVKSSV